MEFRYSEKIDPSTYNIEDDLCIGIDVRSNKDSMGEIRGVTRCDNDWSKLVGPLGNSKGSLADPFSFIRVTMPETLPERLEIVSYASEYAFLYDDVFVEDINQSLEPVDRSQILDNFGRDNSVDPDFDGTSHGAALKATGVKQIQSQIFREMMDIDQAKALTTIKLWQIYVKVAASRERSEPFTRLDEYLPYRLTDAGYQFWVGLLLFAMDLAVSDQEIDLCKQLGKPAWAAVCLTNDIYSWEKERDDAAKSGDSHVINAIWVLMTEHSISEPQAQELCRQKIKEHVVEARHVAEESKRNPELSPALKAYTEAMLYTISGNLVWSTYCPRYHPERT